MDFSIPRRQGKRPLFRHRVGPWRYQNVSFGKIKQSQTKQLFCMIYVQNSWFFSTHVHKLSFSTRSFNCIFGNSLQPIIWRPYSYQLNSFGLLFSTLLPIDHPKKAVSNIHQKNHHHEFTTAFLLGAKRWWNGLGNGACVVLKDQLESFSVFGSEPVGKAQWFTKLQKAAKVFSGGGLGMEICTAQAKEVLGWIA